MGFDFQSSVKLGTLKPTNTIELICSVSKRRADNDL